MKSILPVLIFAFFSIQLSAQTNVKIQLNHFLENEPFAFDMSAKNNLENDFNLQRLEYYLSGFEVTHDGGQITTFEDLYALVTVTNETYEVIDLGVMDISSIEKISFKMGIDEEANHGDPSLWPVGHPLAPTFPSMHWGWAAGYRFIALEGKSGPSMDQELQFHCIGDEFYRTIEFDTDVSDMQDEYVFEIDADYTQLLKDIDISSGLIIHGNLNEIGDLANNLENEVFTAKSTTSIDDHSLVREFNVYPNPSNDGRVFIDLDLEKNDPVILEVTNLLGKTILSQSLNGNSSFYLNDVGVYIANIKNQKGKTLSSRKIIVQ